MMACRWHLWTQPPMARSPSRVLEFEYMRLTWRADPGHDHNTAKEQAVVWVPGRYVRRRIHWLWLWLFTRPYKLVVRSHQSTSMGSFGLVRPAWI